MRLTKKKLLEQIKENKKVRLKLIDVNKRLTFTEIFFEYKNPYFIVSDHTDVNNIESCKFEEKELEILLKYITLKDYEIFYYN